MTFRFAWKLAVSAAVLGAVLALTPLADVAERLRAAQARWLVVAACCLWAVTLLMAWRWQRVARHVGLEIEYRQALREYFLSNLVNQLVPGGVVGDAARAVRARQGADLRRAALSVAIERALGQLALVGLMALGFAGALLWPGGTGWPLWIWALLGVAALAMIPLIRSQTKMMCAFRAILRAPGQLLISALIAALLVASFWASARSVGARLPQETLFTLIPLILCAMVIPLSVGGWGWREGAAAALFPMVHLPASAGVAAGIAYGGVMLFTALPAVIFVLDGRHIAQK